MRLFRGISIARPVPSLFRRFLRASPIAAAAPLAERVVARDHALALQRFLGIAQLFGGATLVAAYALGGPSAHLSWAPQALVGLGIVQMVVGVAWVLWARTLRQWILRYPGLLVASTLLMSLGVLVLGGSNHETLFATSAMAWLIPAGFGLPGRRWWIIGFAMSFIVCGAWVPIDGDHGGYEHDGHYLTALIGVAAAVIPGLWLGRVTGIAFGTLNRWHLVEVHERGTVGRLRALLEAVDLRASRVGELLPAGVDTPELAALRARLRLGLGLRDDHQSVGLATVMDELVTEHESAAPATRLEVSYDGAAQSVELTPPAADALSAVIRRQLSNVARHAPEATTITLTVSTRSGTLVVRVEDDGSGRIPFRAGQGTAWSAHQLARVGGAARYFAGVAGVGFEIVLPITSVASVSEVPGLSVRKSLARFAAGMLGSLRVAGYVVDSLVAYTVRDDVGLLWLAMPVGGILIELAIRFGIPGRTLGRDARLGLASLIAVAVTAIFTAPSSSPDMLIPSTTSVVVLAHLLYVKRHAWWFAAEVLRAVAVAPLIVRHGSWAIELVVIYPIGFSLLVVALTRFLDRASDLERTAADAMGRAALAGAAVRGIALHHDAVDVIVRSGADADVPTLKDAVAALQVAVGELGAAASESTDAREAMLAGLRAAVGVPVDMDRMDASTDAPWLEHTVAGAVDRLTLIELAALAADERASCAPPGLFGRRRLRGISMDWSAPPGGAQIEARFVAKPSLGPPDPAAVERLRVVAEGLGLIVNSDAERLQIAYRR